MPETNPEYPHGTMIRYRCKEGYRLTGNNKIQCQNGTWEDVKFHCLRYEGKTDYCLIRFGGVSFSFTIEQIIHNKVVENYKEGCQNQTE